MGRREISGDRSISRGLLNDDVDDDERFFKQIRPGIIGK